jgi:hypothetical protein
VPLWPPQIPRDLAWVRTEASSSPSRISRLTRGTIGRNRGASKASSAPTCVVRRQIVVLRVQYLFSAGQDGINRQNLQVWTCSRTVSVHTYFLQCVVRLFAEFEPMCQYNGRLTQLFTKYKYIWLWLQCFDH